MNLNNVMRNILLWISISTMINYGETAFTDNRDSVGLLKIIFDKVTTIEWKAKDTEIMSEEKLLVITDTKRFWISQSMEEWNHQLHGTYNEIRIKQINGDKEEELIRFTFFHEINVKIPKFISTPTDKISNYHQIDFEILLIFPKFTELRFGQRMYRNCKNL